MDCAISTPTEELVATSEMASTAQYLCTIREANLYLVGWRCFTIVHISALYRDPL